uniref:Trichohyalin-plectin-homology domain-containing protein n=1 Tax=Arion vulgaris TaxID=1028688 RepID=A0A0B6ZEC7_9EUPU
MEEQKETLLERQAKMRERAKFLKDKRESERLAFVQEKYDQQFRGQCEELRSILSKKHLEQVCLDRLDQLHQKDEMAVEKRAFDDMYARLWEQDMLEKAAREEREARDLHERNHGVWKS